jgi:FAD/FMN-containing dehydrogenase
MATVRTRQPILSDRQGFNRRWYAANVEMVYLPTDTTSLTAAVEDAITRYPNAFSVAGGRHCYEDFVYNAGRRAVIDVSGMTAVGEDPEKGYFVEAGNSNWSMYLALLNQYNLTIPAGSCYSVGVGGHICGGGYGLLSRLHGLTVDLLTGVEIVVKPASGTPAQAIYVSKDSTGTEYDLYWATRGGGGGNFGVISRYYFETLPKAPAQAVQGLISFDWSDFQSLGALTQLINAFELEATKQSPDSWPEYWILKLMHRSAGQMGIVFQVVSDETDVLMEKAKHFERVRADMQQIAPVRSGRISLPGHPMWLSASGVESQTFTYLEALQNANGSGPNHRGKYKSAYMKKRFPPDQVQAIYAALTQNVPGADLSSSLLQVDSYGCAINQVLPTATAIPQRSSILKLQYQTYWQNNLPVGQSDPAQDALYLGWIRQFYQSVYAASGGTPDPQHDPSGTVDGCYYNYPDVDLGPDALRLYFLQNLAKLKNVKREWDWNNYFNHAQSIPVS